MNIWFETSDLGARQFGICLKCLLKYLDLKDELRTMKSLLTTTRGVIPWNEPPPPEPPKPKPSDDLEDWEDDLFD